MSIDQETIKVVIEFMKGHQYDTDAFGDDLNAVNHQQSNLYNICHQNMEFLSTCNQFMTNIYCMFTLFDNIYDI